MMFVKRFNSRLVIFFFHLCFSDPGIISKAYIKFFFFKLDGKHGISECRLNAPAAQESRSVAVAFLDTRKFDQRFLIESHKLNLS